MICNLNVLDSFNNISCSMPLQTKCLLSILHKGSAYLSSHLPDWSKTGCAHADRTGVASNHQSRGSRHLHLQDPNTDSGRLFPLSSGFSFLDGSTVAFAASGDFQLRESVRKLDLGSGMACSESSRGPATCPCHPPGVWQTLEREAAAAPAWEGTVRPRRLSSGHWEQEGGVRTKGCQGPDGRIKLRAYLDPH